MKLSVQATALALMLAAAIPIQGSGDIGEPSSSKEPLPSESRSAGIVGSSSAVPGRGALVDSQTELFQSIRKAAWESLSQNTKKTVTTDWRTAPVQKSRLPYDADTNSQISSDRTIYKVTLNTSMDELLGPIGLYLDGETLEIVEQDIRM
ncbi:MULTISPECIES: hypothetical protein [unclassified Paenibacillus]|uniref:hypothetical protein n=1 Tax=Paenibacillus TaxID=44249 RepID=UPI00038F9B49|nr:MULTISPECIES: hypothetical protein [unclassified Paenibacillus]KKC48659.1 hypothetical protein VE23_18785 [Paenibacillus sp. D9]CDN42773.1 hypothetical protein BN871_BX_00050 [Paenibacillus sp. P22]